MNDLAKRFFASPPAGGFAQNDNKQMDKTTTIFFIIIAILAIAGIAYGAYVYFIPATSQNQSQQQTAEPAKQTNNQVANQADPYAGWKTYTNTQYGFELRYPGEWHLYKVPDDRLIYIQNFLKPVEATSGIGGKGCQLSIMSWPEQRYSSISDWVAKQKINFGGALKNTTQKDVSVGSIKGLEVTFFGDFIGTGRPSIVLFDRGTLYEITKGIQDVEQNSCEVVFNQMLSTFKFTK